MDHQGNGSAGRGSGTSPDFNIQNETGANLILNSPTIGGFNVTAHTVALINQSGFSTRSHRRYENPGAYEDEALRDPLPPPDVTEEFTSDELERKVEDSFLTHVANKCNTQQWRRLGRKLDMDQSTVDRMLDENHQNMREFVYQMLREWKKRKSTATVRDLVQVLCQCHMSETALELRHFLRSVHPPFPDIP